MTVTGDVMGGGTNANVFITLFGKTGTTRKIHLKNNSKTMFNRGSSDTFRVKTNCVGPMKKVRIEHDNTGIGAGWYLERVSEWVFVLVCRELVCSKCKLLLFSKPKFVCHFKGKRSSQNVNLCVALKGNDLLET